MRFAAMHAGNDGGVEYRALLRAMAAARSARATAARQFDRAPRRGATRVMAFLAPTSTMVGPVRGVEVSEPCDACGFRVCSSAADVVHLDLLQSAPQRAVPRAARCSDRCGRSRCRG